MIYWAIKVKNISKFYVTDSVMGSFISEVPTLFKTKKEVDDILSNITEISDLEDVEMFTKSEFETCQINIQ